MTLSQRDEAALNTVTVLIFWGSIILGVVLPWAVFIVTHRHNDPRVLETFWRDLLGPDPWMLLAGVFNGIPFLVYAVFALLHLGKAAGHGAAVAWRRLSGVLTAGAAMTAISLWGNIAILTSRSSTASIGFLFLPIYLLLALAAGYGLGRLLARFWVRE